MKYRDELIEYDKLNNIPHNKDIKRAFEKHAYIHNHEDVIYKPEKVEEVITFIESEFKQTKGVLEPLKLQPTQKWWLEIMFGYYYKDDTILINETMINIIRGAGKSTLMAAIVISWMLLSDNFGGEAQVLAYDNSQSDEVYEQVMKQLDSGGSRIQFLSSKQTVKYKGKIVNIPAQLHKTKKGLLFKHNKNIFKKQTNDEATIQGGNTVLNIFDEVHTYKKLIVKQVNMGSRKQKNWRSVYITSGGITRGGQYDDLIKQFTSEENFYDIRTFAFLYRLDSADEVTDKSKWGKAAPMIGVLPTWQKVEAEYNEAKGDPALQTRFLAYNMGIQTQDAKMYYMQPQDAACREYDTNVWSNADVYVGIDVAISGDWSSVAFLTFWNGEWFVHTESVVTQSSIDSSPDDIRQTIEGFVGDGLTVVEGDRMKAADIYEVAERFIDSNNVNVLKIGYDRYNYDELFDMMALYVPDKDGDDQVAIRQAYYLSESTRLMKLLLSENRLTHNQPCFEWALMNLTVKNGLSGDIAPGKGSYYQKVDPVMATLFAFEVSK